MSETACRIDVWLWRARFTRTRTLAALAATEGRIRLNRGGQIGRIDKASRAVHVGDELVFAFAGRLYAVRIVQLGLRRGPPDEARRLYESLDEPPLTMRRAG